MDLEQELTTLLTPTEAARLKGMRLNRFKYHLDKPDAPRPVFVGPSGRPHYRLDEVRRWKPTLRSKA